MTVGVLGINVVTLFDVDASLETHSTIPSISTVVDPPARQLRSGGNGRMESENCRDFVRRENKRGMILRVKRTPVNIQGPG